MLSRKSVRHALQDWGRSEALGQHPLASLGIVEARRKAAGHPDTLLGHGAALRAVLRAAIDGLRPASGPPDFHDDRWRAYLILTEQYVGGQAPGCVAEQLGIVQSTYHHAQARALDTVVAMLREQEESLAAATQVAAPTPTLDAAPLQLAVLAVAEPRRASVRLFQLLPALGLVIAVVAWLVVRQPFTAPRSRMAAIAFGQDRPGVIAANPITRRVYAADEDRPGLAVIDGAADAVLATIPTEGYHAGVAADPTTNRVYVAQQFAGRVRIIDGGDNSVVGDLAVPGLVQTVGDLALDPVSQRLYVVRANNNDVAVFDTTSNAYLGAVAFGLPSAPGCPTVPCGGGGIAVNPATHRIYLADAATAEVVVIDGASQRLLSRVAVGKGPLRIAVNPVTNTIYVTNRLDGSVSVIDGASHRVVATVAAGAAPIGIAVNPNTNRVYIANMENRSLSVIDGASNLVVATIPLGVQATFAAVLPGAGRIYVSGGEDHTVKVVDDAAAPFVAWTPLAATGGPPTPRGDSANRPAGYDAASNRLLFFGGMQQGGPLLNDTWVLADADGTTGTPRWLQLATANTPPPRRGHAGAYDVANNRLITYGGCLGGCTPLDTNVYVLSHANGLGGDPTWQRLDPVGPPPPPRDGHSAVYDPTSNRLIVFGGDNCCGQRYGDTWVLTHANGLGGAPEWLPLTPNGELPAGRVSHSAVYDATRNRMLVFGGATASGPLNDVWVLSGANGMEGTPTWRRLDPRGALPEARSGHSAVYDADSGQMLVFGGGDVAGLRNDSWLLSDAQDQADTPVWTQLAPLGTAPTARAASSAAYRPPPTAWFSSRGTRYRAPSTTPGRS